MSNKSENTDLNHILEDEDKIAAENALPVIEKFSSQIHSIPKLVSKAHRIDRFLLQNFQEMQTSAAHVIDQLASESQKVLARFDNVLLPIAKEVLNDLLKDADLLKSDLDESLKTIDTTVNKDWIDYAKKWTQLYAKWYDRKGITKKVLKLAGERTSLLIEKDIKVIKDYQDQTLAGLPKESEEFQSLERRLYKATAEPLRNLVNLKSLPKDDLTIKQASDWMVNLQKSRESFFDQVLIKIDSAVKEVVSKDSNHDDDVSREIEGELAFIDQEIKEIKKLLSNLHLLDKEEVSHLKERVQSLVEHLEEYDLAGLRNDLKERMDKIHQWIESTMNQLR